MQNQTVLVPIAPGSEEMEAVIMIDVLRRAGLEVIVASCCPDGSLEITASRGVKLVADCLIPDCVGRQFALIALPGGMPGAEHLRDNPVLEQLLREQAARGGWLAAICAAPAVVLHHFGLLEGSEVTCHPAFQDKLTPGLCQPEQAVVIDSQARRITSQAPGTAMRFALTLVELLCGAEKAQEVARPMVTEFSG